MLSDSSLAKSEPCHVGNRQHSELVDSGLIGGGGASNAARDVWTRPESPGLLWNAICAFSCGLAMSVHEVRCFCKVFSGILLYRI